MTPREIFLSQLEILLARLDACRDHYDEKERDECMLEYVHFRDAFIEKYAPSETWQER